MPHDPEVLAMHNAYQGRVFILGCGPSLIGQRSALAGLREEYTFSCNGLPQWKELPFEPTFHGVTDIVHSAVFKKLFWPDRRFIRFNVQFEAHKDIHMPGFLYVEKAPDNIQVGRHGFVGLGDTLPPVPTGRTTPLTLAQVAAWLGFQEIYFLGVDMSRGYCYAPDATESGSGTAFPLDDHPRTMRARQASFARARTDMEAGGRKLVDCTPGGFFNITGRGPRRGLPWQEILPYKALEDVLKERHGAVVGA